MTGIFMFAGALQVLGLVLLCVLIKVLYKPIGGHEISWKRAFALGFAVWLITLLIQLTLVYIYVYTILTFLGEAIIRILAAIFGGVG